MGFVGKPSLFFVLSFEGNSGVSDETLNDYLREMVKKTKVVPLKCSGSWSAGLAAAAMRGTGGHPLLPGLAEVVGCRGPERLLFEPCCSIELSSISDKLAATREKGPTAVIIYFKTGTSLGQEHHLVNGLAVWVH